MARTANKGIEGDHVGRFQQGRRQRPDIDFPLPIVENPLYLVLFPSNMAERPVKYRAKAAKAGPSPTPALADRDGLDDRIIGAEGGLKPVMSRVAQVARSSAPVLILGETGSGKEVVARAIHTQSDRSDGPFIRVNCGALPAELVDSELFGHERGSFTGAMASRRGWFEQAHQGTLLLDEIGELSLAAQVRLLRILQDGVLQRVGAEKTIRVDVRLVAATHRDLADMVKRGRFREDLWYRIAVFPILLPPLRDHREDIPAMAEHFARRAAARFGLPFRAPAAGDVALLTAYSWPGNVRELAAVIDRAVLIGEGRRLDVARALGAAAHAGGVPAAAALQPAPGPDADRSTAGALAAPRAPAAALAATALRVEASPPGDALLDAASIEPLEIAIRRHIERALAACHGRVDGRYGAARLLEVNPQTLRAKMRKLGIDWASYRSSSSEMVDGEMAGDDEPAERRGR
ncbi:MAG TPA: sigma-54 dependent transcriptional regulator [Kofleriaceae bacterium]|nr:sigma-54 dependent transcriptional regulator [Kofleriaceae bacterium]